VLLKAEDHRESYPEVAGYPDTISCGHSCGKRNSTYHLELLGLTCRKSGGGNGFQAVSAVAERLALRDKTGEGNDS
jgi:hypothetical protein